MGNEDGIGDAYKRGVAPSLVEAFSISGLHGYRTLSLSSPYAATILIAKNGSGKTTLLGALDAFLKAQFSRLRDIPFNEIRCKLSGVSEEIVLTHADLHALLTIPAESQIHRFARRISLDPLELFHFLIDEYDHVRGDYSALADTKVYGAINKITNYSHPESLSHLDRLREELFTHVPQVDAIVKSLRGALSGVEILYLPTYRRIEVPLSVDDGEGPYRRRKSKVQLPRGIFAADIQFGLQDISDRLRDLNQKIVFNSNRDYRQISADIVNELVDSNFDSVQFDQKDIPSKDELGLFFSRLKDRRRDRMYFGPFDEIAIPNIDKIYTGYAISSESNKFLRYFLNKLGRVIKSIREIEAPVDAFIANCNSYLSFVDESTKPPEDSENVASPVDGKELRLDRKSLSVYAASVPSERKIPLEALSSGEKQMVSLFAKLYLYPEEKLVLIDEPELSLSLDWQRKILPDVISAPLCRQVIAITHSPFVFDNELEPFARSLKLTIDPHGLAIAPHGEEGADLGE